MSHPLAKLVREQDNILRAIEKSAPVYQTITQNIVKNLIEQLNIFLEVPKIKNEKGYLSFKKTLLKKVKKCKMK